MSCLLNEVDWLDGLVFRVQGLGGFAQGHSRPFTHLDALVPHTVPGPRRGLSHMTRTLADSKPPGTPGEEGRW